MPPLNPNNLENWTVTTQRNNVDARDMPYGDITFGNPVITRINPEKKYKSEKDFEKQMLKSYD